MGPATKQDVVSIVESTRARLFDRMATKQDMQLLLDQSRTMLIIAQQSQQLLRQAEMQQLQLNRKIVALETRINQLDQELRTHKALLNKAAEQRQAEIKQRPVTTTEMSDHQRRISIFGYQTG